MSDTQISLTERTAGKVVTGDQWPAIVEALHRHFGDQPDRLDALLIDLANLPPIYEVVAR